MSACLSRWPAMCRLPVSPLLGKPHCCRSRPGYSPANRPNYRPATRAATRGFGTGFRDGFSHRKGRRPDSPGNGRFRDSFLPAADRAEGAGDAGEPGTSSPGALVLLDGERELAAGKRGPGRAGVRITPDNTPRGGESGKCLIQALPCRYRKGRKRLASSSAVFARTLGEALSSLCSIPVLSRFNQ